MEIILFWSKKLISRVLFPIPLFFEIVALGLILCAWKKTRRAGFIVICFGMFWLMVASVPFVGKACLGSLEDDFEPIDTSILQPVQYGYVIGVAGEDYDGNAGFGDNMLIRLQEAGRIASELQRRGVNYKIVVSIYKPEIDVGIKQEAANNYFKSFGIPASKIAVVDECRNSKAEVYAFSREKGQLIIVSNAFHMHRLMLLAKQGNTVAHAAPAGFQTLSRTLTPLDFVPSAEALNQTRIATYEYLGILDAML